MDKSVDFGPTNTGLVGTVGYEIFGAGSVSVKARTTAGITEVGATGIYQVSTQKDKTMLDIVWDNGSGLSAVEDLTNDENQVFLRNRNETNQDGTPRQTVYQDDSTTVYMEGPAFEDQAGTTPYAGKGIERRNRLV